MNRKEIPSHGVTSQCGKWIHMPDGSRFRRKVLPSFLSSSKDEIDIEDALKEADAVRTQEIDAAQASD